MATKRKSGRAKSIAAARGARDSASSGGLRKRRSDEEKVGIVRQILASAHQAAEMKKLGIYPNQFYDWKKRFGSQLGSMAKSVGRRGRAAAILGGSAFEEARTFIQNKSALLERLRAQRVELDQLIRQLED